jgi:hypothetical protein
MTNNKAREIKSPLIEELINETTPEELAKIDTEMTNNKQQTMKNTQQTNLNIPNETKVISQTTTNTAQGYWVEHLKIKVGNNEQQ